MTQSANGSPQTQGVLGWIERTGNRLPDPVFIFVGLILVLVVISALASMLGVSALHPTQRDTAGNPVLIQAASLLSAANIRRLLVEMPTTFTYFPPLGMV
ncbi:MAG: AbgT family transporter, partial [Pseudohongiellaceae bacterium]